MADPSPMSAPDADALIDVSPARLMWRRFRKHRVAMISMVLLFGFAIITIGAEFFAATDPGLPEARGQTYRLPGGSFFSLENGLITRVTTYYNLADWLKQVA